MADGVWKVFGRCKQLSQNKFFDPSTQSMRKGCSGGKKEKKRLMRIVATTSLQAVDCLNDDRCAKICLYPRM